MSLLVQTLNVLASLMCCERYTGLVEHQDVRPVRQRERNDAIGPAKWKAMAARGRRLPDLGAGSATAGRWEAAS